MARRRPRTVTSPDGQRVPVCPRAADVEAAAAGLRDAQQILDGLALALRRVEAGAWAAESHRPADRPEMIATGRETP